MPGFTTQTARAARGRKRGLWSANKARPLGFPALVKARAVKARLALERRAARARSEAAAMHLMMGLPGTEIWLCFCGERGIGEQAAINHLAKRGPYSDPKSAPTP